MLKGTHNHVFLDSSLHGLSFSKTWVKFLRVSNASIQYFRIIVKKTSFLICFNTYDLFSILTFSVTMTVAGFWKLLKQQDITPTTYDKTYDLKKLNLGRKAIINMDASIYIWLCLKNSKYIEELTRYIVVDSIVTG